jgi:hypothetical protein
VAFWAALLRRPATSSISLVSWLKMAMLCVFPITSDDEVEQRGLMAEDLERLANAIEGAGLCRASE